MTGMSGLPPSMSAYALNTPGPKKNISVAGDVDDQIQDEEEAGDADQELRADRRIEDARSR